MITIYKCSHQHLSSIFCFAIIIRSFNGREVLVYFHETYLLDHRNKWSNISKYIVKCRQGDDIRLLHPNGKQNKISQMYQEYKTPNRSKCRMSRIMKTN